MVKGVAIGGRSHGNKLRAFGGPTYCGRLHSNDGRDVQLVPTVGCRAALALFCVVTTLLAGLTLYRCRQKCSAWTWTAETAGALVVTLLNALVLYAHCQRCNAAGGALWVLLVTALWICLLLYAGTPDADSEDS